MPFSQPDTPKQVSDSRGVGIDLPSEWSCSATISKLTFGKKDERPVGLWKAAFAADEAAPGVMRLAGPGWIIIVIQMQYEELI